MSVPTGTADITGTPTTFINGELYAMSGGELLSIVRTILLGAA